ncbi:MAG: molybdenum cofactor guanylyltransferase [Candidatus Methanomethyliaceae archaeon]
MNRYFFEHFIMMSWYTKDRRLTLFQIAAQLNVMMFSHVSAILLCGGGSTRMGQDKGLINWEGRPLVLHMVEYLQTMFQEVLLVTGSRRRYANLVDLPIYTDQIPNIGPLGGIYTGLLVSSNDWNLVIAYDMPCVRTALVTLLVEEIETKYKVIVPYVNGYFEPLLGLYHKDCLPEIERMIATSNLKPIELFWRVLTKVIPTEKLRQVDPHLISFLNINTQEELRLASRTCPRNQ